MEKEELLIKTERPNYQRIDDAKLRSFLNDSG